MNNDNKLTISLEALDTSAEIILPISDLTAKLAVEFLQNLAKDLQCQKCEHTISREEAEELFAKAFPNFGHKAQGESGRPKK
jgi:hypothetical protein